MSKFECSICLVKFKVLKYFHCDKCGTDICKQCLKDSLITYGKTHPNCPNCHENISYTYLAQIISKKFIYEDLFDYLTNIEFEVLTKEKIKLIANVLKILLLSSENKIISYVTKSLYNSTQNLHDEYIAHTRMTGSNTYVETKIPYKKTTSIYKEIILNNVELLMNELKNTIENQIVLKTYDDKECSLEKTISINIQEICEILYIVTTSKEIKEIFQKYLGKYINKDLLTKSTITTMYDIKRLITKELKKDNSKTLYIFRCTECEFGFIDKKYICNSCNKEFCSKCLKEKHEDECNENDVKTAELIYKDTKPCPNCYTRIFKISGCNQMFCTYCKKGFDWVSGKIIRDNFHNPHRMEWLQQGGMDELPDLECMNDYRIRFINKFPAQDIQLMRMYFNYITDILREHQQNQDLCSDINELTLLVCYLFTEHKEKNKQTIDYGLTLSEKNFKYKLKSIVKSKYYESIYCEIYQTMRDILSSALIRIDQILGYKFDNVKFNLNTDDLAMIENLYTNCYNFLRDIEKTRINELETYLDMNFIKPVNFKNDLNCYYWNPRESGLKTFEEFYDIYSILVSPNNEEIDLNQIYTNNEAKYNKYFRSKIGKIFQYVKRHIKTNTDKQNALKNISKLNLSFEEKEFVYNLFK